MESRWVDAAIAFVALLTLIACLGTLIVFVPDPALITVLCVGMAMAGFDFFKSFIGRRNKR